jgi:tartrate dehydrogenase/decarboxylase/D-malate dehydrogenase
MISIRKNANSSLVYLDQPFLIMKKQIFKSLISKSFSRSYSTTKSYTIGIIPGDGIGVEILPFAKQVLLSLSQKYNFQLKFNDYPYSCKYYLEHGKMLPEDGLELMKQNDALLLGAIGDPRIVLDHISLRGLLLPIRQQFDQYINLRPAQKLPKIPTPLKGDPNFDICVVRENTEGFVSDVVC